MRSCRPVAVTSIFFFSLVILIFNTQRLNKKPQPKIADKTLEETTSNISAVSWNYSHEVVNGSRGGDGGGEGHGSDGGSEGQGGDGGSEGHGGDRGDERHGGYGGSEGHGGDGGSEGHGGDGVSEGHGGGKGVPSVVFSECTGRLGNQISTFAILLVFHKIYGFTPHLNKQQIKLLSRYFDNVNFTIFSEKIPKNLVKIELEYQFNKLRNSSYNIGYSINIGKYPHSLTLYNQHLSEINHELKLKKKYIDEANRILSTIASKHSGSNITFIGVHVRRDDYQKWMTKRLGKKTRYVNETYFIAGMDEFRRRFGGGAVFVVVSDDSAWIAKHLGHLPDVYIGGKVLKTGGKDPSARDFALLCQCNHSLLSYGSFGQWAALRNRGQVILPKQTRRLSREMVDPDRWARANLTNWTFI